MVHASVYLPGFIVGFGFPLSARFPLIPRPAELAPAAFFPASCSDRRPTDHIRRCPRNLGRSQSLSARPGCLRNPTMLFARGKLPFHRPRKAPARPKSTARVGVLSQPLGNRHTPPRESPSTSTETARSAASEGTPKKPNWGESSKPSPPRKAAPARATVFLSQATLLPEPYSDTLQSPRSPSSPSAESPRSTRSR